MPCTPIEKAGVDQALACAVAGSIATVRAGIDVFVAAHAPDELLLTANVFDTARAPFELAMRACLVRTESQRALTLPRLPGAVHRDLSLTSCAPQSAAFEQKRRRTHAEDDRRDGEISVVASIVLRIILTCALIRNLTVHRPAFVRPKYRVLPTSRQRKPFAKNVDATRLIDFTLHPKDFEPRMAFVKSRKHPVASSRHSA
jgi:hypothetical protein